MFGNHKYKDRGWRVAKVTATWHGHLITLVLGEGTENQGGGTLGSSLASHLASQ